MDNQSELLNTQQAADYLGVSYGCMAMWRHRKTGPVYIKIGSGVRYKKSDLDAFVKVVEPEKQ